MSGNVVAINNEQELISILSSSLYPGASNDSISMVLSYCRQAQLDPMQKPVHIVPMWDSKAKQMRDVVMPGIGLYRIQAARSGEYGGISEPQYGDDITGSVGGQEITYPKYCKVTVTRLVNGTKVDFTATEFWLENYAIKGGKDRSIAPNAMWSKRPYGQLAKCAEAQALRKAFPEFGAQPTAEEMEGKNYDASVEPQESELNEVIEMLNASDSDTLLEIWKRVNDKYKNTEHMQKMVEAKDQRKKELMENAQ